MKFVDKPVCDQHLDENRNFHLGLQRLGFRKERARPTFLFCLKHAQSNYYDRTGDPCGASRRIIMEFAGLFPA